MIAAMNPTILAALRREEAKGNLLCGAAADEIMGLVDTLAPFCGAWQFAKAEGRAAHLSLAQLARLASGELSGAHFQRADRALTPDSD